jgi:glycosyltransferase involved in cell wall biosynthesis
MFNVARRMGLTCALNTGGQVVSPRDDPFGWGRFNVFPWDSGSTIAGRLDGWYSWAPKTWQSMLSLPARIRGKSERDRIGQQVAPSELAEPALRTPAEAIIPDLPQRTFEQDLISIVVPTFNRCDWLDSAIRSLDKLETEGKFRVELVVVDNASTDTTEAVVRQCQAELNLSITYLLETKPGDAPTRNSGVRNARGRWMAFFDDDQIADPNWLLELHQATLESGATIVGGAVHLYLPPEDLDRLGSICRKALRETLLYSQLQPYVGNDLPGTGNALVERRVFEAVGLFDESMSGGGSDFAFFERARRSGYELWYTPKAIIRHRIAPQRMTPEYFRWDALSSGAEQAYRVHSRTSSAAWTGLMGVARIAQAILVSYPLLLWGMLRRKPGEVLGRRTRLWRVEGYWRKLLSLISPKMFRQSRFFDSLEFRNSRSIEGTP